MAAWISTPAEAYSRTMSDPDLILAIDQGTTGSTALILDRKLAVLARANREFNQHFPRPGRVEHEAEEIWASVVEAIQATIAEAEIDVARIAAIGITNQRETSLVAEK